MSNANSLKNTLSALLLALALNSPSFAALPPKHIAITQYIEHVAADAVRDGLLEELAKEGYTQGENLIVDYDNAQGNAATAGQIARKFLGLKPDVIVAITTPSAQSMVKVVGKDSIPIVFGAVTNPVGAGLVSSLKHHPEHVTGVMDAPPIKEQIAFIKTILPDAKKIGVLYNPGDNGSVASLEGIRKEASAQGLTIVESTPIKSSDIQAAVLKLVGQVDAIYVPLDNMLVSAMKTVSSLALQHKLPLFSADSGSVEAGALACKGYSYHETGLETGKIVTLLLKGEKSGEIDIVSPGKIGIFINRKALETLHLSLPDAIREQAHFY
jgi:putative ABC transport system substrate-binding protein